MTYKRLVDESNRSKQRVDEMRRLKELKKDEDYQEMIRMVEKDKKMR